MRAAPLARLAVLLALAGALAGCGGDDGPTFAADVADGEVAAETCGLLVAWTNDVADTVNAAQGELVEGVDVPGLMADAVDELIDRTERLADDLAATRYPDTDGGRALARTLLDGAEAAAADLEGLRDEIEAIPDPDPESFVFRRSQLVVEIEKPRSLVKPDVPADLDGDDDLAAAFAAEDACTFVTRDQ